MGMIESFSSSALLPVVDEFASHVEDHSKSTQLFRQRNAHKVSDMVPIS